MNKNDLIKILFPYALDVAKAYKISLAEKDVINGNCADLHVDEVTLVTNFMNQCIKMLVNDVSKNFTVADMMKFMSTAHNIADKGLPKKCIDDFVYNIFNKDNVSTTPVKKASPITKSTFTTHTNITNDTDVTELNTKTGTPRSKCTRNVLPGYTRSRVVGNVMLYSSIEELKHNIPNVKNKDIYRIAAMIPNECEYAGVPPMYYVSANGNNSSVARKSYREYAHKNYEISCEAYKKSLGVAFGYSVSILPAYKKNNHISLF